MENLENQNPDMLTNEEATADPVGGFSDNEQTNEGVYDTTRQEEMVSRLLHTISSAKGGGKGASGSYTYRRDILADPEGYEKYKAELQKWVEDENNRLLEIYNQKKAMFQEAQAMGDGIQQRLRGNVPGTPEAMYKATRYGGQELPEGESIGFGGVRDTLVDDAFFIAPPQKQKPIMPEPAQVLTESGRVSARVPSPTAPHSGAPKEPLAAVRRGEWNEDTQRFDPEPKADAGWGSWTDGTYQAVSKSKAPLTVMNAAADYTQRTVFKSYEDLKNANITIGNKTGLSYGKAVREAINQHYAERVANGAGERTTSGGRTVYKFAPATGSTKTIFYYPEVPATNGQPAKPAKVAFDSSIFMQWINDEPSVEELAGRTPLTAADYDIKQMRGENMTQYYRKDRIPYVDETEFRTTDSTIKNILKQVFASNTTAGKQMQKNVVADQNPEGVKYSNPQNVKKGAIEGTSLIFLGNNTYVPLDNAYITKIQNSNLSQAQKNQLINAAKQPRKIIDDVNGNLGEW